MENSAPSLAITSNMLLAECCNICGKKHNIQDCDYVQILKHVPDNEIPSRAKLTLPKFLSTRILSDGSYATITKSTINKGTKFGPFQAEKTNTLEPTITFPLKVFEENNCEYFLDATNEEKCSWLMFVGHADYAEEQNLICYQDSGEIYYVAIKDIRIGETLKVWYAPYYAQKMNKPVLSPKTDDDPLKNVDIDYLIKKQQKITERKVWTCKFCSHIENNIALFAKHILKHYTAQHKNKCELCKKTWGSKKALKNHLKIVHKMFMTSSSKTSKSIVSPTKTDSRDVVLGGPLLNDMFTDSSDLQQFDLLDNQNLLLDSDNLTVENLLNDNVKDLDHFNFEIDDSQKQFICDICFKQFNKMKLLIVHLRQHTGDFMCFKCLKIFCRKENLKSHICNLRVRHRCNLCDRSFTQPKYLSRHLGAIHNKKYSCVSCGKNYYSNKELLEHNCSKIPIADKERFMCPICDKLFFREIYLKRHLKTHDQKGRNSKPTQITCDICGLNLIYTSYFSHKKKHEEPSYVCEVCNKKFHRADSLREHILVHQSNEYECNICHKKYKTKKALNYHIKQHNVGSYKCSLCDATFKLSQSLNRHVRNFHKEKVKPNKNMEYYNCPICQKSIKLRSSVLRHLKKAHPEVTNIDLNAIRPKLYTNKNENTKNNNNESSEIDDQINNLLNNAQNNSAINKNAVDSLVEELDINNKNEIKQTGEVCVSIPDLTENYQEITLDKNAYILDNGTIVQPQANSENVVIYVLDQTY
ncbi:PR domain zinc finger protein 15-like [Tribolium madens]|uniref:PR domain zinc finger protein 15-like n=1 Tax=Tribolium madens TaxID=41895 RepID=UPI001CF72B8B|nr:PR domain zinc finger protein 15-like [Tribolium madens]